MQVTTECCDEAVAFAYGGLLMRGTPQAPQYAPHTISGRDTLALLLRIGENNWCNVYAGGLRRFVIASSEAAAIAHGLLPFGPQRRAIRKRVTAACLQQRTLGITPRQLAKLLNVGGNTALAWELFTGVPAPAPAASAPYVEPEYEIESESDSETDEDVECDDTSMGEPESAEESEVDSMEGSENGGAFDEDQGDSDDGLHSEGAAAADALLGLGAGHAPPALELEAAASAGAAGYEH